MPQMVEIDGEEKEVFTQEEIEAKAAEIAEAKVAEATTASEAALKEKEEELEKLRNKEMNFNNLRNKSEKTDEEKAEIARKAEELEKSIADMNVKIEAVEKQPLEAAKNQFIANNIGGDKDLKEKFDFFYEKIGKDAKTMDEVNQALAGAFNAAAGGARQPDFTGRAVHTSVNDNFAGINDSKSESEDSQGFGQMLGLSPEDKKTYGGAVKNNGSIPLFTQAPVSKE
jgi:hypothetical protein